MDAFALTPAERQLFAALRERDFADEYDAGIEREIEGVVLRILPLERVIASKRATSRPKDAASLPALEAALQARRKVT